MTILEKLVEMVSRLTPKGGTAERAVKGTIWVMSQNIFGRVLQLSLLIILARYIGPTAIGLVGIALLILSALKKFTNIGLNAALIQRTDEDVDSYLNTVWVLEISRGTLIGAVVFISAPLIAGFFSEPRATDVIRVMSFSPLLFGLRNPGVVYLQKNLHFHKQFLYQVGSEIIRFGVGIGAVLVSPTVWAYVAAFIAAAFSRMVFSYAIHGYRPRLQFDRGAAKDLIDYGKWITGSSVVYFLYSQGDDAFVGWLLTPAALAFYQYAYRFSNAPATEFSQVISSVMFPTFSKIQEDSNRLRETFIHALRMTSFVAFPAAAGIAAVAPSFVRAFLGEQWVPMVAAMQVLAIYGLFRSVGKAFGPVWKAVGRPDIITKLGVLRVILIAVLIYPLTTQFGIVGTALTVTVIYVFPMMPLDIVIMSKIIDCSPVKILREFFYPTVTSAFMFGCVWYVHLELILPPIAKFFVLIAVGVLSYAVAVLIMEFQFNWGVSQQFRTIIANVKK